MNDRTNNPAPVEDWRVTAAREALTASSLSVMSGELGYTAESVVEALQEAVDGLLELIAERSDR